MNDTVGSEDIEEDDEGAGLAGLELYELVPGHAELLPGHGGEAGGAGGEVLAQHPGAGHQVSQ